MSDHVLDALPDWLHGALDPVDLARTSAHLEACGACAAAALELTEVLALYALVEPPTAPDPGVRARLLDSTATGRLHRFAGLISQMFGIDDEAAKAALDSVDDSSRWVPSDMPGVQMAPLEGAPPNHLMGFIKLPRSGVVPWHEHLGRERTLVLQGRLVDDDGVVYGPGQEMPKTVGTRHTFHADGPLDLLCAVIIENGWTVLP